MNNNLYNNENMHNEERKRQINFASYSDLFMVIAFIFLFLYVVSNVRNGIISISKQYQHKKELEELKKQLSLSDEKLERNLNNEQYRAEKKSYENLLREFDVIASSADKDLQKQKEVLDLHITRKNNISKYHRFVKKIIQATVKNKMIVKDQRKELKVVKNNLEEQSSQLNIVKEKNQEISKIKNKVLRESDYYKKMAKINYEGIMHVRSNMNNRLNQVSDAKDKIFDEKNKYEKLASQYKESISQKELNIKQMEEQNKQLSSEINQREEKNEQIQKIVKKLQEEDQKKTEDLKEIKESISQKELDIKQMAEKNKQLSSEINQREEKNEQIQEIVKKLQEEDLKKTEDLKEMKILAENNEKFKKQYQQMTDEQSEMREQLQNFENKSNDLSEQISSLNKEKNKITDKYKTIERMVASKDEIRKELADRLKKYLKNDGKNLEIDAESGDVVFKFHKVYFSYDSYILKKEMKKELKEFIPNYAHALFGDEKLAAEIRSIELIGFASPTYRKKYIDPQNIKDKRELAAMSYNLDLSYKRAKSIFKYFFHNDKFTFKYQTKMLPFIKVAGVGYLKSKTFVRKPASDQINNMGFCGIYDCSPGHIVKIKFNIKNK